MGTLPEKSIREEFQPTKKFTIKAAGMTDGMPTTTILCRRLSQVFCSGVT